MRSGGLEDMPGSILLHIYNLDIISKKLVSRQTTRLRVRVLVEGSGGR